MHYKRYWTHGDVDVITNSGRKKPDEAPVTRYGKVPDDARFWKKVDRRGDDECWMWTGGTKKKKGGKAYGRFGFEGKNTFAHRYSYGLHSGEFLGSHTPVHHTCGESLCVNPRHLQATTPHENTAEMLERQWYLKRIAELEAQLAECRCGVNT